MSDRNHPDVLPPDGGAHSNTVPSRESLVAGGGDELLEDGQEEVFSYSAVERGMNIDPLAMDPALFAPPKSKFD